MGGYQIEECIAIRNGQYGGVFKFSCLTKNKYICQSKYDKIIKINPSSKLELTRLYVLRCDRWDERSVRFIMNYDKSII